MNNAQRMQLRRNARIIATSLAPVVREAAWSDRYRGRAAEPPGGLTSAERTCFSAAVAALDMSLGRGRRVADRTAEKRELNQVLADDRSGGDSSASRRAVRLLHQLVPVADDLGERARILDVTEPVTADEFALWPLVQSVARQLAGVSTTIGVVGPSPEILAADAAYGELLDHVLERHHSLSVLATLHTWVGEPDRRRFETTTALLDRCFASYRVDIDPWTAGREVWSGLYIDTTSLISAEIGAHRTMDALIDAPIDEAITRWREVVQPLARVNAVLRRLERLGADVDEPLHLPTEPQWGAGRLRPSSDLFSTENLRRLMLLGLEVLDDPIELWAWQNLWSRGCRPQACLPQSNELLPFDEGRWRVLVPRDFSKTGMIVDYVASPIATLVGWSPQVCPDFVRSRTTSEGVVPTHVAESACRKVRVRWAELQQMEPDLPALPDRLAYMTRKLLALWMAQRTSTPVFTRWMSHANPATNHTYSQPTIGQLAGVRDAQRGERT
jgi:hypothetical protein